MKLAVRKSGSTKGVVGLHVHKGGVVKLAERAWLRTGGALKQFIASFAVSADSSSVFGYVSSGAVATATTSTVTASATGAIGTPTYSWVRTDLDSHPWTITNPTGASTAFSTTCARATEHTATFACTVTDSAGQTGTAGVSADCINEYGA